MSQVFSPSGPFTAYFALHRPTMPTGGNSRLKYIPLVTDRVLSGTYGVTVVKEVGHGYAGTVLKCLTDRTHQGGHYKVIAVKVMAKGKIKAKNAENEGKLLRQSRGPNVLEYITSIECMDSYMLVTEFCGKGDLHGMLGLLDSAHVMAREYLLGVASGLECLHERLIAHRDIKMKNILIGDDNVPKIADFGFAAKYPSRTSTTDVCHGTKDYWAPEMFTSWPQFDPFKADIYALGVTFVGVCEKKPIKRSHDNIHRIVNDYANADRRALFHGMLMTSPNDRLTLEEIKLNRWLLACTTPPPSPPKTTREVRTLPGS